MDNTIILGESEKVLPTLPDKFVSLIYIDPPFNTGKRQKRGGLFYNDCFDSLEDYLIPIVDKSLRCLKSNGSLFVHLDCREVHYIKVCLDRILGRDSFMNEIIWSYDYGGRSKKRWPAKHDTILWYARNPSNYTFNYESIDRIPYLAPGLVGEEKAAKGKTPTDVWWHTIVPTNGKEKTGYPTQKPMGVLRRIIKVHSNPGECVLDYFAGSGTTGAAAGELNRRFVLIDSNKDAYDIMVKRLNVYNPERAVFE